jgi:hypothetical protein
VVRLATASSTVANSIPPVQNFSTLLRFHSPPDYSCERDADCRIRRNNMSRLLLPPQEMVYIFCLTYLLAVPGSDQELLEDIKAALRSTRCWPDILASMETHKSELSKL